jgi:hypothetical protein
MRGTGSTLPPICKLERRGRGSWGIGRGSTGRAPGPVRPRVEPARDSQAAEPREDRTRHDVEGDPPIPDDAREVSLCACEELDVLPRPPPFEGRPGEFRNRDGEDGLDGDDASDRRCDHSRPDSDEHSDECPTTQSNQHRPGSLDALMELLPQPDAAGCPHRGENAGTKRTEGNPRAGRTVSRPSCAPRSGVQWTSMRSPMARAQRPRRPRDGGLGKVNVSALSAVDQGLWTLIRLGRERRSRHRLARVKRPSSPCQSPRQSIASRDYRDLLAGVPHPSSHPRVKACDGARRSDACVAPQKAWPPAPTTVAATAFGRQHRLLSRTPP